MRPNDLQKSIEENKAQLRRIEPDDYFIQCHWNSLRTLVGFIPPGALYMLDIGCGPNSVGLTSILPDINYVGIDFVHEYLSEVRKRYPEDGPFSFSRRRWLQSPMEYLPFANDTFDIVYSRHVLEHSLDLNQTLSEIKRVLKPGGRFIFCVPARIDDVEPTHMMRWPARKWLRAFRSVGTIRFHAQHNYYLDELYGYAERPGGVRPGLIQRMNKRIWYWMGQGYIPARITKVIWQVEAIVARLRKHP